MRRLLAVLLVLPALPVPVHAQQISAEQALANQRSQLLTVIGAGTGRAADERCDPGTTQGDEIVVCGRDDSAGQRLELPREPVPGERQRMLGEPPTGTDAMAVDRCFRHCQTGVMFDVFAVARGAAKVVGRILDPDSD